ncbi:MAG: acyl carrier protein [Deltaproteobacteria bacterium]|nr:acyl carrier protein [Deltaproteobacteria bacterium]
MHSGKPVSVSLHHFVSEQFMAGEPVDADQPLLGNIVDSLGVLQLADFIEAEFNVRLLDLDLTVENLASLRTLTTLVERRGG